MESNDSGARPETPTFIEIEPYTETTLDTRPALVVYHQGDEEQTVILHHNGTVELRGPHDWHVQIRHPGLDLDEVDAALAGAKDRWDHAGAPYNPDMLALIRAAEQLRAHFPAAQ